MSNASTLPMNPTASPTVSATLACALVLSIGVHVLLAAGFFERLQNLFAAVSFAPPASTPIAARIIAPAPTIERVTVATPAPIQPGVAKAVAPTPRKPTKPRTPKPSDAAPTQQAAAPTEPTPTPPAATPIEPTPPTPPAPEPVAAAPPELVKPSPATIKVSPFPLEATIKFFIVARNRNAEYKATMTHVWQESAVEGAARYRIRGDLALPGFSNNEIYLSEGSIGAKGLTPARHERQREGKAPEITTFDAAKRSATVEENGASKPLTFVGEPVDQLSLLYDLALEPEIEIGRQFAFARGATIYPFELRNKGRQRIDTEMGGLDTLYFDFKRTDDVGQIEVWLALDKSLLPAKMRMVTKRGEEIEMTAARYTITKPR